MILVSNHIFLAMKSLDFILRDRISKMAAIFRDGCLSSIKITFRYSFATNIAAVAELGSVVDVVPVFYESSTSSGWITGTGPFNGTWSW